MIDEPGQLTAALSDRYRVERELGAGGRILVAEPVTNSYQLILVRNGLRGATSRTAGLSDR